MSEVHIKVFSPILQSVHVLGDVVLFVSSRKTRWMDYNTTTNFGTSKEVLSESRCAIHLAFPRKDFEQKKSE